MPVSVDTTSLQVLHLKSGPRRVLNEKSWFGSTAPQVPDAPTGPPRLALSPSDTVYHLTSSSPYFKCLKSSLRHACRPTPTTRKRSEQNSKRCWFARSFLGHSDSELNRSGIATSSDKKIALANFYQVAQTLVDLNRKRNNSPCVQGDQRIPPNFKSWSSVGFEPLLRIHD